jgi:hypothetical protein
MQSTAIHLSPSTYPTVELASRTWHSHSIGSRFLPEAYPTEDELDDFFRGRDIYRVRDGTFKKDHKNNVVGILELGTIKKQESKALPVRPKP